MVLLAEDVVIVAEEVGVVAATSEDSDEVVMISEVRLLSADVCTVMEVRAVWVPLVLLEDAEVRVLMV